MFALRRILEKHGKKPCSPLFRDAFIRYTKQTRNLLQELTDEADVRELKSALARADVSIFLTIAAFLILGGTFLAIGK